MKLILRGVMLPMLALVLLAGCSKKVTDGASGGAAGSVQQEKIVTQVNETRHEVSQVTSHVSVTLSMGSKDLNVSGELKMKRNELIQLSLTAFFISVGRLELTPEYLLIMDNINKRYVEVPYTEVPFFHDNGIDYYSFQALLWNELFVPGKKDAAPVASDYSMSKDGSNTLLSCKNSKMLLAFIDNSSGILTQTHITGAAGHGGMVCQYLGWSPLKQKNFADHIKLDVNAVGRQVGMELEMSKMKADDSWKAVPTDPESKKFTKLSLQEVWGQLLGI